MTAYLIAESGHGVPLTADAIVVGDSEGVIAQAWSNYRRSFAVPDLFNEETRVPRMEFLIDRYGFGTGVDMSWVNDMRNDPALNGHLQNV